ncbi:hypothetical protein [Mucilaginibacter agri]|uniref:Uncharacterized protein n=1 Tax=Mucilaginibacter agri TaxID=2695265 RepID=A0A965ZHH9_9SPHI|nr:hypothetical protein [Mucilaginibacter agri]NCD69756.1 hypothetical protein [Mucilaginibacter agri]
MREKIFWITSSQRCPDGDIIYAQGSGLRIRVCRLNGYSWIPTPREVQLYCLIGDEMLAFETIAIKPDDARDMAGAVRWYATYHGSDETLIYTQQPQLAHNYLQDRSHIL